MPTDKSMTENGSELVDRLERKVNVHAEIFDVSPVLSLQQDFWDKILEILGLSLKSLSYSDAREKRQAEFQAQRCHILQARRVFWHHDQQNSSRSLLCFLGVAGRAQSAVSTRNLAL
jgi:hypothetical protein